MASFEAEDQAASEPGPAEPADPMDQSSGEAGPSKPKQSGGSTEEWWHSDDSAEDSDDEPIVVQDELYDEEEDDELELDQVQQGNVAASQTLSCPCCFTVIVVLEIGQNEAVIGLKIAPGGPKQRKR